MNKARIQNTTEIVFAEELLQFYPNYKELIFVCVDKECSIRMSPACINKNSKKRPHFKKYRNQEHIEKCEYAILNELTKKGKDQRLTNIQINKIGYPSVFKIEENVDSLENEKNDIQTLDGDEGVTGRGGVTKLYEFDSDNISFNRKNKVQSIDRIVDWYLGFPHNRDVELEINGDRIQYRYFFKRIGGYTDSSDLHNDRIFYGMIRLSEANKDIYNKYDNYVYISLLGYRGKDEISGKYENYSIKINKNNVSKTLLSRMKNKYDSLFDKAYEDYKTGSIPKNFGFYVFVYGKLDSDNELLLNVTNHHITFRYDEVRKTIIEDN